MWQMPGADPRYGGYNLDPSWINPYPPPVAPIPHRPHRVAYVFAVVLPILLLAVLALPVGAIFWLQNGTSASSPPTATAGAPTEGGAGVGDPYFPDYGSSGYDAIKYDIGVSFDPASGVLTGTTTMTARAEQQLSVFFYDLVLTTELVTVNGQEARFERQGTRDVKVVPQTPINDGAVFQMQVTYSGKPADVTIPNRHPWSVTNQEWTAAGEPESAPWWFPCDDYPNDPALMDVSIRVPAGLQALSVGRLESRDTGNEVDWDTWHWVARQPMATYLNFMSIGKYEIKEGTVDNRPYVYAVTEQLAPADRQKALGVLAKSGAIVRTLEGFFGPYPFSEIGGIVPAHRLGFGGLENQTRPVYAADAILDDSFAIELIAHELSHMWFGDNVTVRQWNDICTNECWASWGQWAYSDKHGGEKLNDRLIRTYDRLRGDAAYWQITLVDPGREHLFDVVYSRGPMMLQALRNRIGDDAFFTLARKWAQDPGSRSLEEWMVKAQSVTRVDLAPFFRTWVIGTTAPARTAENGFP